MSVLITADDFGLHPSVNAGIVELAQARRLDCVSVMVHQGACQELRPELLCAPVRIGPHLTLVEERGLLGSSRRLAPAGVLPANYRRLFFGAVFGGPGFLDEVEQEMRLQILTFLETHGRIDFINSHQHTHLFPPIWLRLMKVVAQLGLRCPVRGVRGIYSFGNKQFLLECAGLTSSLISCPNPTIHPIGVDHAGRLSREGLRKLVAHASSLTSTVGEVEIVTHPGHESEALRTRYAHWQYTWEQELKSLRELEREAAL